MQRQQIADLFGETWVDFMLPFIQNEEWPKLLAALKAEKETVAQLNGCILPLVQKDIFAAFRATPWPDVKVVFLGMDPYPTKEDACGLSFAVQRQTNPPETLSMIIDVIEKKCYSGLNFEKPKFPLNLQHLIDQGFLLLNSALTVRENASGSHREIWEPFTRFVMQQLNFLGKDIIFVGIGAIAQTFTAYVTPFDHYISLCEHPMKAKKDGREWDVKIFTDIAAQYIRIHRKNLKWYPDEESLK
jgi:uracil-DNA glycosylase